MFDLDFEAVVILIVFWTHSNVGKVVVKKSPDRQEGGGITNLRWKRYNSV